MQMELEKDFNPFYDSVFMISLENDESSGRRYLVELYYDELVRLRNEIDCIISRLQSQEMALAP